MSPAEMRATIDRARALIDRRCFDAALAIFHDAVARDPQEAELARNLGMLLSRLGRLTEGEAALRFAVAISGGASYHPLSLGLNLLMQGRHAEGWPLYRTRDLFDDLNTGIPRDIPFARWDGIADLAGRRLLLVPEQGMGDQIQFVRFVPALVERGVAVTMLVLPPLGRLFRHSLPGVDVQVATGTVDVPHFDAWAPVMDLFGAAALHGGALPRSPYLSAPGRWRDAPPGFKIGLMTAGNRALDNDSRRSLSTAQAAALRALLPGQLFDLDPARSGARDFADTAALIDALDVVVTVDTAVAHLAGAMGKKCLLMVPGFGTDWRWMRDRRDSPWYPSMTLYRDDVAGDWAEVFEAVAADARALMAGGLVAR